MMRSGFGSVFLSFALACVVPAAALAQGQAMPPIKVNLPPTPNFDTASAPVQHPTGELSVFGLRKGMSKYLDKDVRVKGYLLEIYECPAEIRKCNEEQDAKAKRQRKDAVKAAMKGAAPEKMAPPPSGGCRPCDQPHFFIGDKPDQKKERALLVADYPVKDWKSGRPKPLTATKGEQYVLTGTFAINSMTGFAASNGLLIHKKMEDAQGKVIAEGNAVLPPEAQTIQLEGQPAQVPAKR